ARTDPAAIRTHSAELRAQLLAALGGFPERCPLHVRTTGIIEREGYRVEKVIFESRPKFYVTAALFLPDPARPPRPWPGVLVPCGHYPPAKAWPTYQAMGSLLALNGMAALVCDPVDEGERHQLVDGDGRWRHWGTKSHAIEDIKASLLGQNIARYLVWD